eukprot:CAMPEP_0119007788 /NCGR_PEP_ID=MMETSP1176-20130426/3256_1 /TAXON_ID=265551 /ORGANISM="Synedropsis recta cf, Strain CCMP1620" /LENGTH=243 /DNA_ID=CAMNT_0006960005 /DNA_START=27 /DNA_END=758 /DNA_ORIENTATION=-
MTFVMLRLFYCLLLGASSNAFVVPSSSTTRRQQQQRFWPLAATVDVKAASTQLLWETLDEKQSRPVLNLSNREMSPEQSSSIKDSSQKNSDDWNQGQIWSETEKGLQALGFGDDFPTLLLQACPQLYRLETAMILETAAWCIDTGFDIDYIMREPRILSYKCVDVEYGLDFIGKMLMLKDTNASLGIIVPPLLLSGIDGGLQERAVQKALGDASDATYSANTRIAGDAVAALNQLKQQRNNKI